MQKLQTQHVQTTKQHAILEDTWRQLLSNTKQKTILTSTSKNRSLHVDRSQILVFHCHHRSCCHPTGLMSMRGLLAEKGCGDPLGGVDLGSVFFFFALRFFLGWFLGVGFGRDRFCWCFKGLELHKGLWRVLLEWNSRTLWWLLRIVWRFCDRSPKMFAMNVYLSVLCFSFLVIFLSVFCRGVFKGIFVWFEWLGRLSFVCRLALMIGWVGFLWRSSSGTTWLDAGLVSLGFMVAWWVSAGGLVVLWCVFVVAW